ncbi:hypothetical protein MesoLj131c_22500 [Mesorhizobium sp. 131-3-5]|nr:hypothetical protein MesoLj131c_22500 [Mesorhizobium sp. 131-3-5]
MLLGRVQADMEIVIAGRNYDIIGDEIALLVSDSTVIARLQDDDVTIRSWRHRCAGNFVALPVHQIAMTASGWIGPVTIGAVRKCRDIVK